MLSPYGPGFGYGPWIAPTRRDYIEHVVRIANKQVAVPGAFGADWVTTSLFRQRLLVRRGARPASAQALIRADVPQLSPGGPPGPAWRQAAGQAGAVRLAAWAPTALMPSAPALTCSRDRPVVLGPNARMSAMTRAMAMPMTTNTALDPLSFSSGISTNGMIAVASLLSE